MKRMTILFLICVGLAAGAVSARAPQKISHNEDLQYIGQWVKAERAARLADHLVLNAEQVASLRALRARVDKVKTGLEPRLGAAESALALTAARIRNDLENGGSLNDEAKTLLRNNRHDVRAIHRESRRALGETAKSILTVLNAEQWESLRSAFRESRERKRAARVSNGLQNAGRPGERQGRQRKVKRFRKQVVRVLLSDAFLNRYP